MQIGIEVKNEITKLLNAYPDIHMIFIAGNHDYYSPLEEFAMYNAYELVFGADYYKMHPNMVVVADTPYKEDESLFLPWYWTENENHFDELLYQYKFGAEIKCVYCHTDLSIWPGPRITALKGIPVYAGHIHYPYIDTLGNLYNIGAALPLTFNDVNDSRHIYVLEDHVIKKKIENISTPHFKRFFNEDIFRLNESDFNNSYVQLYVSNANINTARYIERIKEIKTTYMSANIFVRGYDETSNENDIDTAAGFDSNITMYIENNIPEHLSDKYEYIKSKVNIEE